MAGSSRCLRAVVNVASCASWDIAHEPRLMLAAFVLSQLAALPDALLALWLMLLGKASSNIDPAWWKEQRLVWYIDRCDVVSPHDRHARAAALPRQGDHRVGVARRATGKHR